MQFTRNIRVINDSPLLGPANMARDEALMHRVGEGLSPPTLRLYQWESPTVSLGYFQRYADFEALDPPLCELPVVRRLTGGGAILHDLELTYSIALAVDHPILSGGPNRLYELAHDALIAALLSQQVSAERCGETDDSTPTHGPFFCFERRHAYDVLIGKAKLAGSAQRRTRSALLQHGSIIVGNRYPQQHTATLPSAYPETIERLRNAVAQEFADLVDHDLEQGQWLRDELTAAEELVGKYSGDEWTRRT